MASITSKFVPLPPLRPRCTRMSRAKAAIARGGVVIGWGVWWLSVLAVPTAILILAATAPH